MISWVIAAYDEEKRLPGTLDRLIVEFIDVPFEVIISDDGSNDKTFEIAETYSKLHEMARAYLSSIGVEEHPFQLPVGLGLVEIGKHLLR